MATSLSALLMRNFNPKPGTLINRIPIGFEHASELEMINAMLDTTGDIDYEYDYDPTFPGEQSSWFRVSAGCTLLFMIVLLYCKYRKSQCCSDLSENTPLRQDAADRTARLKNIIAVAPETTSSSSFSTVTTSSIMARRMSRPDTSLTPSMIRSWSSGTVTKL